jgi:HD-GYP domain-containing protein (c-di-GMP phosphodiesterase class II)
MSTIIDILNQSQLFAGLDDDTLTKISERFVSVSYPADAEVFREGDVGDTFYIMQEGEAAFYKNLGTVQHKMRTLGIGDQFGERALISSARRVGTVKTVTPIKCLCMDEAGFNALMESEPHFAQRMLKLLVRRMKESDDAAARDMVAAHQALSFSLAKLADSRDPETGGHLYRVRAYCVLLSELLAEHPTFDSVITDAFIEHIHLAAPLHDIGKVAIPDGVLMKQGKLTDAEFQIMMSHTLLGAEALDTVIEYCDHEMFQMARRIILCHHERWDGSGYPNGLKDVEIPVEARIMALADIYDALLSERVYKRAFEYNETKDEILSQAGTRFDPQMVTVMLNNIDMFESIHQNFREEAPRL